MDLRLDAFASVMEFLRRRFKKMRRLIDRVLAIFLNSSHWSLPMPDTYSVGVFFACPGESLGPGRRSGGKSPMQNRGGDPTGKGAKR